MSILAEGDAKVHTGSIKWTYEGREREEMVEWSEKDLHSKIKIQLTRVLKSREVKASEVKTVFAVIGGNHGDTAFQFGAALNAVLQNAEQLYSKVCCC